MSKKALRLNEGKAPLAYVLTFPEAIRGIAKVCEVGEAKYARLNYLLAGKPSSEYVNSLMRHLLAWHTGEDIDPESGCHHLDHVVWNSMALSEFVHTNKSIDDRPHVVLDALNGESKSQD